VLTLSVGTATHRGLVRPHNEDSALHTERFVAVADGLGGHAAGERASRLAVDELAALTRLAAPGPSDVVAAIAAANGSILRAAAERAGNTGMGTTLAGIGVVQVAGSEHWIVFNVGDSRVYRWAGGAVSQITVDHSEVEEMRSAGRLTAEQARSHPGRNIVTRSLGTDPAPEPDVWVFPPLPEDTFVICSDGLTTEVTDAGIAQLLAGHPDPQMAADALVQAALAAGGRDNVTAIVVALALVPAGNAVDTDTAPRIREAP
jgi:serine/threonine protein phosphatase PrpC